LYFQMSDVKCSTDSSGGVSGGQGATGRGRGRLLARIKANAAIGAREEPAEETTVLSFPRGDMGRIIGKGGSTKKEIEEKCRAQVQVGWILMRGLVDLCPRWRSSANSAR
jgi:hypothetical protein